MIWRVGRCVALMCLVAVSVAAGAREPRALKKSKQMVVLTTADWNATTGTLRRYERDARRKWIPVGDAVPVVVGKNGMGWGAGLMQRKVMALSEPDDPVKHEGDKKSPAGIFGLGEAFGFEEKVPAQWKMPYVHLTSTVECVDDAQSKFYNQVVDRATVSADWTSSEKMAQEDPYYRWGLVVNHNAEPARPGVGSCVFLHVWDGPQSTTSGCTAMAQEQVEALLGWLDPQAKPVLLEMPGADYEKVQRKWHLPRPGVD